MSETMLSDETVKYKKNTGSDVSKASRKARHKHMYVPCIVNIKGSGSMFWEAKYCSICGKLRISRGIYHIEKDDDGRHVYSSASEADILTRYGNEEAFQIRDYFQPYVTADDRRVTVTEIFRENAPHTRVRYTDYEE